MKENLLSNFITNQYNIGKLEEVIRAFLNLTETAIIILSNEDYNIKITSSYEMKLSSRTKFSTTSRVESFLISKYDSDDKLKELLYKYSKAFNTMTKPERELFSKYFIRGEKKSIVMRDMGIYQYQFDPIKKSAVVKFCLVLGLDKYIDVV